MRGQATLGPPIRPCSAWGLPCPLRFRRGGALLPHPFTLTPVLSGAVYSLRHFPSRYHGRALPGMPPVVESGPSSETGASADAHLLQPRQAYHRTRCVYRRRKPMSATLDVARRVNGCCGLGEKRRGAETQSFNPSWRCHSDALGFASDGPFLTDPFLIFLCGSAREDGWAGSASPRFLVGGRTPEENRLPWLCQGGFDMTVSGSISQRGPPTQVMA